ncbi:MULTISPECIES: hypothetical protein [unclassified Myroides]|uniref:hypothetical protein n=1 Tax=unclassified Myroides TaxID=2642485 RepID=UPI003D2F7384
MKVIPLLVVLLLLTSCATIFNKDDQKIYFYTATNKESLKVKDSIYSLPAKMRVMRSKDDLKVTLINDTLTKEFTVLSETDPLYFLGNVVMPIGYLIDENSSRRYIYKDRIYLSFLNESQTVGSGAAIYQRKQKLERSLNNAKGDLFLYLTYSPLNYLAFDMPKYDSTRDNFGTWLMDIGATYYYADKRFIQVGVGMKTSGHLVPIEYRAILLSSSLQVLNFHEINRLNLGYGLFVSDQFYREEEAPENPRDSNIIHRDSQTAMGISLAAHFKVSNTFSIGLGYQSNVYRLSSPSKFNNGHVVSVELTQRIRLSKKKSTFK